MQISVIIPTLDEADRIGDSIAFLRASGFEEVVVSDGGSSDATAQIAWDSGAIVIQAPRGRGIQLQYGAAAATKAHLFFLHADSLPPADARHLIEATLSQRGVIAGCFRLSFDHKHLVLAIYATMSRINHAIFTYGDQGLFLSRATYDRVGGYSDAPLFEDVDILKRLARLGRVSKRQEPMMTSARRFLRDGIIKRELTSTGLILLYALGVSPQTLARWYRPEKAFRE